MVAVLPHESSASYNRAIKDGSLEGWRHGPCPCCDGRLAPCGTRRRKTLGIVVLRAHCEKCDTYYTFLPAFAAPAKWYGYSDIEEGLRFVLIDRASISPTAALFEWEMQRVDRLDSGETPGPSSPTVRRWVKELGQLSPQSPWPTRVTNEVNRPKEKAADRHPAQKLEETAKQAVVETSQVTNLASKLPMPRSTHQAALSLFLALQSLGEKVAHEGLGFFSAGSTVLGSLLALGTWYIESLFHQRCIAVLALRGAVIPCVQQPFPTEPKVPGQDYPPSKSHHPP